MILTIASRRRGAKVRVYGAGMLCAATFPHKDCQRDLGPNSKTGQTESGFRITRAPSIDIVPASGLQRLRYA